MTAATLEDQIVTGGRGALLGRAMHDQKFGGFEAISDVAACLMPLLEALGWSGPPRQLAEALPHFANTLDIVDLRGVLANLNYATRSARVRLGQIDVRLMPCLLLQDDGPALVVLGIRGKRFKVFNGASNRVELIDGRGVGGVAYFVTTRPEEEEQQRSTAQSRPWFEEVSWRFRGLAWQMAAITFLTSLLALAVPLFIMAVYDWVIPGRSVDTLVHLFIGVLFALVLDGALRTLRARLLAYVGARIDMIFGRSAFEQILYLPIIMTERAPIGSQISRLRQFEAVREFFIGPLATVILELPFVLIFIAVIAVIAGHMAWIPVVLIACFAVLGVLITPPMRRAVAEAGDARARRQAFQIEMLSHLRTIKTCSAEAVWSARYRERSARAAMANFENAQLSFLVQTLAQLLMLAAGIATLTLGALQVMAGAISVGALVASMALIWRILAPLQMGFLSLTKLEQVKFGIHQLDLLMRLGVEREPGKVVDRKRTFKGEITFTNVSMRYTPGAEPAMVQASFEVAPGELVAVTGANGSGKSTLLKLIAGLYPIQAGAVLIDGIDIRQLDVSELRNAIACVPQYGHLFHGTVEQNLRLANPMASDADLARAVLDAGLLNDVLSLPEGFDTRITDRRQHQLPSGFRQRLILARAYVKQAPIYLLDEPANNLDRDGDVAFQRKIQSLKRKSTIVMVTQRPSHMRMADRLLLIRSGRVALDGPPDEILEKLSRG